MEGVLTEASLDDVRFSALIDPVEGSEKVLVSFGGIANRLPIPVFEFMRSLDRLKVNKVFIRDFSQCWYTNGIKGLTESPTETLDYLKALIARFGRQKCVFLGNSAGGYAALLYGRILNVSEVHAFSPQTFLDGWNRLLYWDRRWPAEIAKLNKDFRSYFDLKEVFASFPDHQVPLHIYWDGSHRLDNIHANRLAGPNIRHSKYKSGGHAVIKTMKASGELDLLLEKSLTQ